MRRQSLKARIAKVLPPVRMPTRAWRLGRYSQVTLAPTSVDPWPSYSLLILATPSRSCWSQASL